MLRCRCCNYVFEGAGGNCPLCASNDLIVVEPIIAAGVKHDGESVKRTGRKGKTGKTGNASDVSGTPKRGGKDA